MSTTNLSQPPKQPKMILFDYGQTLVNETPFDGVRGTAAVLSYATENRYQKSAAEVQAFAEELNHELGRFDKKTRHLNQIEIPNYMFTRYLYEAQGITLSIGPEEIDRVFWNAAAPGQPTDGCADFLALCKEKGIRTGVISNITFCEQVVIDRIHSYFKAHDFEFILTTSAYLFRKPHPRIFEIALQKAGLSPEEVWFVGDQYQCDIVGAKAAGLFPVWYIGAIDTDYKEHPELLTIKHWNELTHFL